VIHVVVREYARLTTEPGFASLDCHTVSNHAFEYLRRLSAGFRTSGAALIQLESGLALRMDNYVGVIETPCGTVIEILPKHAESEDSAEASRGLLVKMLATVLQVPAREAAEADIQLLRRPLTEWVMRRFVLALDDLVKRGIRSDYLRVEEEQRYLRGQLDLSRQLRQQPGRQHWFQLRHDIYSADRPENRLLKLAVSRVRARTQDPGTWRLANELESLLVDIPPSRNLRMDLTAWRTDRLMAHYSPVRPWCELVLGNQMPIAQHGTQRGISLLFPMERLFEEYVARKLVPQLAPGVRMTRHASTEFLCRHDGGWMFQLQPDILLVGQDQERWILDTKWKRVNGADKANKYGLSQADFYQLHAYGQRYLGGSGALFLVFPRTLDFATELSHFHYSDTLRLRVVPFDLDTDMIATEKLPFLKGVAA
jgi:5-methylcytosine-specific restriction enzyme subunit McrC